MVETGEKEHIHEMVICVTLFWKKRAGLLVFVLYERRSRACNVCFLDLRPQTTQVVVYESCVCVWFVQSSEIQFKIETGE